MWGWALCCRALAFLAVSMRLHARGAHSTWTRIDVGVDYACWVWAGFRDVCKALPKTTLHSHATVKGKYSRGNSTPYLPRVTSKIHQSPF